MTDFAISKPATFAPEQSFACPDCGGSGWIFGDGSGSGSGYGYGDGD